MNKEYLKSYLYNVEIRLAAKMSDAVLNRVPKNVIMKEATKEILNLKYVGQMEKNRMWIWSTNFYRSLIRGAARKVDLDERARRIYAVLRQMTQDLEHVKNVVADMVEHNLKHRALVEMMKDHTNHFFYCTEHASPAEGHRDYQGKVYYRKNLTYTKAEMNYIRSHKLIAVEDVVMGPVWLTTRNNCRHRLIPISFKTAKRGEFGEVFGMKEEKNVSYEESQYRNYRDRYKLIEIMKRWCKKNDVKVPLELEMDIKRTRNLIRAWNEARKNVVE